MPDHNGKLRNRNIPPLLDQLSQALLRRSYKGVARAGFPIGQPDNPAALHLRPIEPGDLALLPACEDDKPDRIACSAPTLGRIIKERAGYSQPSSSTVRTPLQTLKLRPRPKSAVPLCRPATLAAAPSS